MHNIILRNSALVLKYMNSKGQNEFRRNRAKK